MRKNVKQQLALRVLSTAALMAMVSSIATAAFAAEYNVADGSVEIVAKDGSQSITQWADKDKGTFVKDENGDNIDHRPDSKIVLVTKDETTGETKPTSNTVTITAEEKGDTANVTLKDVFINREGARNSDAEAALTVKGDGDTNIELNGNNTLSSTGAHAGLEKTDAECSGTLTITDDKNDDGSEKKEKDEYGYSTGGDTGSLAVIGGGSGGAGIGGQGSIESDSRAQEIHDASNITITGGNISAGHTPEGCDYDAHWNPGAGIGGGSHGGDGTNITITGNANVDAYGSYYAAGIGGADYYSKKAEDGNWYTLGGNGENITISGNAKVTARGWDAAGIGGASYGAGKNIQIKDNADVHAYAGPNGAGIGGGRGCGGEVSISGNATVFARGENGGSGIGAGDYNSNEVAPERRDTTVTISDNATVTAIGSYQSAGIGNGSDHRNVGKTDITITGGTVNAISGSYSASAIGGGKDYEDGSPAQNVTVTINGTTGNTTINASCTEDMESAISKGNGTADIIGYDADGVSPFGEDHSVVVRMYKKGSLTLKDYDQNTHRYKSIDYNPGELYQTVHNRKYMEEHPEEIVDITKLKDDDLHAWQPVPGGEYKKPTLEEDGYADYICSIDKCGQTKHVVLPKLTPEPSEPDTTEPDVPGDNTPDAPNKPDTPKQPDGTTPAPVTPDAPVQDSTAPADTLAADTTADAAVVPADAQNVAQNAEPKAAAAPAVLPQTGANWLAVVGTALSGMFLLAAGFVLDRKNRRMN